MNVLELLDRRLAEDGRRLADEVLPELARGLLDLGRRPEPHQPFLETLRLEVPANDSSTTNTTRCPRSRKTWPIPTQLFVGP